MSTKMAQSDAIISIAYNKCHILICAQIHCFFCLHIIFDADISFGLFIASKS